MKKSKKNMIIGSGIAAGAVSAAAAISHGVTRKMASIAMDRPEPKVSERAAERVTGTSADSAFSHIRKEAAEQLSSREHEIVEITAKDGVRLVGHWFYRDDARRTIVAMHGWRSSWVDDFGIISDFWLRSDCNVLFAEQRGQNNSGGDHMSFGLLERYDCVTWANWAAEQISHQLPMYLVGVSMGATSVLMASELELPENVCGIAADSAFTSPHAIWKHVSENNLHIPYALHKASADRMCQQRINLEAGAASTTEALKRCKVPVFLVHGTDDHFVPVEMTYENYKACASEKRLLIVPGADHCMSYLTEKESYERTAKEFWEFCEQRKKNP